MKAKFVVFIVALVVLATTGAVLAESYQESSCGNYVWVEFPGPLGESASWNTTDKAVLTTRLGFYSLVDRDFIIVTGYAYDIVLVAYTEPDTALNLRIGVEKEDDPNIQKGTGTFSWNLAGYWDLVVASNAEGVVEVVVHVSSVVGLPGKTHFVSAGYGDQTPESWQATVSSGGSYQVFLPLITR